jgi:hypothetical protein
MNNWAKPELQPEIIALLSNRAQSFAELAKQAGYTSVYLFKKDYKDHIKSDEMVKGVRKRKPKTIQEDAKPATPPPEAKPTGWVVYLIAAMIGAVGLVLGAAGLALNYQFARSLGQSPMASHLLGILGVAIDAATIFLPSAGLIMLERRRYGQSFGCAVIWFLCLGLSLIAGMSFAANNIGDSLQSREAIAQHRKALNSELAAVQSERGRIKEDRDSQVLEQSIQIERSKVPLERLKSSKDCTDVTTSGQFCNELNQLRASKRTAERRIELDERQRKLTADIAALPPVAVKDPGADHISLVTGGMVQPDEVENFRVIGFAFMPSLAGFLLAFARTLCR